MLLIVGEDSNYSSFSQVQLTSFIRFIVISVNK